MDEPIGEEYKLLLRDAQQLAKTMLDVRADMSYAATVFRIALVREALARCNNNRSHAAQLLKIHRNTFTRCLPLADRKCQERFETAQRSLARIQPASITRQELLGFRVNV